MAREYRGAIAQGVTRGPNAVRGLDIPGPNAWDAGTVSAKYEFGRSGRVSLAKVPIGRSACTLGRARPQLHVRMALKKKIGSWVGVGLAVGLIGCKPQPLNPDDDGSHVQVEAETEDGSEGGEASVSPFGMSPMVRLFTGGLDKPGPYEEPKESESFSADAPHYLVLELDEPIGELHSVSLLSMSATVPLRGITEQLRKAALDEQVQGIIVRANGPSVDMATAQELRDALVAFKSNGARRVLCHTEGVVNAAYYVLAACDRIALAPLGNVIVSGPVATPVHVKGLLDRLGITADFLHVGAFKGAAEPITRDAPSPEMIETLEAIVEQSYQSMLEGIEQGRGLDRDAAIAVVDTALFVGEQAVEARLVDEVATWEAFRDTAVADEGWKVLGSDANPLKDFGALQRFLGLVPPERPSGPHVALVYAVGNIVDGEGSGIVGAREEIASRTLVAALRAVAADEEVAAVVLRVDSGGGSALASEQIWMAASQLAEKKPLVVSMGSVAASGGYYISAAADKIYARQNTLTGSIGVVGGKIAFGGALEDVGVETYAVKRGERAMMWSTMDPWTASERDAVRQMMEATYERFLQRVSSGRSLTRGDVHAIAQGRVWTGVHAEERGLVDALGGLEAALAEAHRMADLEPGGEIEVYPPDPTLRDLLSSFGEVRSPVERSGDALLGLALSAAHLAGADEAAALERILGTLADLRDTRVWALSWVRPPI